MAHINIHIKIEDEVVMRFASIWIIILFSMSLSSCMVSQPIYVPPPPKTVVVSEPVLVAPPVKTVVLARPLTRHVIIY
jgi:hypothetical protein